jgi:hypothetical protein
MVIMMGIKEEKRLWCKLVVVSGQIFCEKSKYTEMYEVILIKVNDPNWVIRFGFKMSKVQFCGLGNPFL